ncbi:MAG: quinone oxidoreductase [Oligoflexia bacterium]|nr:quinone oxidoreductase [Oligoflexia bacterium]
MPFAIRVHEVGGPEKMLWEEVETPRPGPHEVLIRNRAVGLNFIDVYYRNGLYSDSLPLTPGAEGAGVVEAVGSEVKEFKPGDRVGYAGGLGAYSELVIRPASRLARIPADLDEKTVAAVLLKGMTAEFLIRRTHRVQAGETILVHAAAGGVGQILCQWAKHLGARVIGTVGSEEKAALAKQSGCEHVIVSRSGPVSKQVRELTEGKGVPVVYDGIGKATFMDSLDCLAPRGLMVSFGNASGAVEPFPLGILAQKGSLYVTRPTLMTYVAQRDELEKSAHDLFSVIQQGAVKVSINQTYPLREAARAHRDLEARKTTGSSLLLI